MVHLWYIKLLVHLTSNVKFFKVMAYNNKVEPYNQYHLSKHASSHPKIQVNNDNNELIT